MLGDRRLARVVPDVLGRRTAPHPLTTASYVNHARRFLLTTKGRALNELEARDVTEAVMRESATGAVSSAQYFVAGLRLFLGSATPKAICQGTCPRLR